MKNRSCHIAWAMIVLTLTANQTLTQSIYEPYTFTTLAGSGPESADGMGNTSRFNRPSGMAVDNEGNVYVADTYNHTIRKLTPAGAVTTLAGLAGSSGNTDGMGSAARFNVPSSVTVDSEGNVYVADTQNHTIRKVTATGVVTTLAGLAGSHGAANGAGSVARFNRPSGVAVDSTGNIFVADTYNHTIRKVTPTGVVTKFAGQLAQPGNTDGSASTARFWNPSGVTVDNAGNIYVANRDTSTIRKIRPTGAVTTLAGLAQLGTNGNPVGGNADGTGITARFNTLVGVTVDGTGNLFVADSGNNTIRKVTPAGVVTTLAGLSQDTNGDGVPKGDYADGTGNTARFNYPCGVAVAGTGDIYVADTYNNTIRKVTPDATVTTLAGQANISTSADGTGSSARFNAPVGVTVDSTDNIFVADSSNHTIRKVTPTREVTTLAGLAGSIGSTDGTGIAARFNSPAGVAVDGMGNVYVADAGNYTIRKVTPSGTVTTLAGLAGTTGSTDGTGSVARFGSTLRGPSGVTVDSAGNVYVADERNFTIRKVTPSGIVTTLAGLAGSIGTADGTGSAARFAQPASVAVDASGNVYVGDLFNQSIRKVTPAGVVTTLAGLPAAGGFVGGPGSADGAGSAARFYNPRGVAVDSAGNVYVAEQGNNTIRKVTPSGVVSTLAGLPGGVGSIDGTGITTRFYGPSGIAVDSAGNLYVTDTVNNTIRKGFPESLPAAVILSEPDFITDNGQFGFNLTGPTGRSVVVEASVNLMSWLPLWTNTFTFPSVLNFSDPQSGAASTRFYRARLP